MVGESDRQDGWRPAKLREVGSETIMSCRQVCFDINGQQLDMCIEKEAASMAKFSQQQSRELLP